MDRRERKKRLREFQARQRAQQVSLVELLQKELTQKIDLSFRRDIHIEEVSLTNAPQIIRDRFVHFCDYLWVATEAKTAVYPWRSGGNIHSCLTYWTEGPWDMMNDEELGTHYDFLQSITPEDFGIQPTFLILKVDDKDKLNVAVCNNQFKENSSRYIQEIVLKKKIARYCTTIMDGTPCEEWVTAGFLISDCL